MRFRFRWLLPVIPILIFLVGPRIEMDGTIHPLTLPDNPIQLDHYLQDQENQFPDLIPGTEKSIVWTAKPGQRTKYAVVYIHGFSASRQDTAPLAEIIANRLQANLHHTRLTGHGRGSEAMREGSVNAWLNDTVEAFEIGKQLGDKVILIGNSTGGTAAVWLATQTDLRTGEDSALHAAILLSPNFAPADRRATMLTWPWGKQIATLLVGEERIVPIRSLAHEKYWTTTHPIEALLPMMGLVKLTISKPLEEIRTPMLAIYAPDDNLIDTQAIVEKFGRIGSQSKQLLIFSPQKSLSSHTLAGDILAPSGTEPVAEMILQFLRSIAD